MARACLYCQRGKVHKHVHLQPAEIPVPHRRFAHIHVDLVGLLPPSRGHTYLFNNNRSKPRGGRRPFHSHPSPPPTAPGPSSPVGYRGLESPPPSHQTGGPSSRPPCGQACVQPAQHPAFTHESIPSTIERIGGAVPQAAEGLLTVRSRRRRLARPPPWVMLGIRSSFREDSEFSPAEAVFGSQLILPGQFVNTAESPSPSFLSDLQTTMTGRPTPPTRHNSAPAPSTLPEELLLARFVLVRQDGAQPPLSPIYDGPYRVLERSTHFFLLEMGERTDKVSTLRLKAARTPADTEPAKPPHRGRPIAQAPPVHAPPPKQRGHSDS
jgi:hypothetical protein